VAVACDFVTVDTALLRRYYLLLFIDVTTRRVYLAGITPNPTGAWTVQAARNLFLRHGDRLADARALVRDRGSQFGPSIRSSAPKASRSSRPQSDIGGQCICRALDRIAPT
jgi:hypothetical protein